VVVLKPLSESALLTLLVPEWHGQGLFCRRHGKGKIMAERNDQITHKSWPIRLGKIGSKTIGVFFLNTSLRLSKSALSR
jgi:hypothetical protein